MTSKSTKIKIELNKYLTDDKIEIGVDEAGRGPLFGPVYSAAVILPKDDSFQHNLMKDSKKFHSEKKLEEAYNYIIGNALAYGVGIMDELVIDQYNIRQATFKAMNMAINKCLINYESKFNNNNDVNTKFNIDLSNNIIQKKYLLLVDGNDFKPFTYFNKLTNEIEYIPFETIEGGDNKYTSIAAGSIIAKYQRDQFIYSLTKDNPDLDEKYNISKNKGYGAKAHMDGIKEHGITKWHRRTYGICRQFI
jgi:ribonuclease HII